ncbi:MAG TPA: hypothetical protein P5081_09820 [Phycisphaerae bacterium]|nr:hypothetical protein [Phycisphaerae bacterium]HRW53174.1 hypothetical protein [Phycisphaerae bacterium]
MFIRFLIVCLVVGASACRRDTPPPTTHPTEREVNEVPKAIHKAEELALAFVADTQHDKYAEAPPKFPADFELSAKDRETAFRLLEQYIKAHSWTRKVAVIEVFEGNEDSASVYLSSPDGALLALSCGYRYDTGVWELDAYEIPARTFARPKGESFTKYIERQIQGYRGRAAPYATGPKSDGVYMIDASQ